MNNKIYRACAYLRLSREDEDKRGGLDESNSIKSQRMMIESVVVAAGKDMQICINGGRDRILNKSQFGAFLSQARFGTDNGVDVDKVAGLLTGA